MSTFQHLEEFKEEGFVGKGNWEKYCDGRCSGLLFQMKSLSDASWFRIDSE